MRLIDFDTRGGSGDRLLEREHNTLYEAIHAVAESAPDPRAAWALEAAVGSYVEDGRLGDDEGAGWSRQAVRAIRDAADAVLARLEPGSRPRRAQRRRSRR